MLRAPNLDQNYLLAALCEEDLRPLAAHLESVRLPLGTMLYQPGEALQQAWFPTSAIVSLHHVLKSGASSEAASVGCEGMVGIPIFLGGQSVPSSAIVQTAGHAFRLDRQWLLDEFQRGAAVQRLLLRYTSALMTQMAQTAICNRHHCVEQQLCRWLLSTLDRMPGQELVTTQELVASMLGVRREGISNSVGKLQQAGFIHCRRGHIRVVDRAGLEKHACECYGVVKGVFTRLLEGAVEERRLLLAA